MDIYDKLGVTKYINGTATLTAYGGSIMYPQVFAAMEEASKSFVNVPQLQKKVGEQIAAWTGNEAAFISDGAASGMALAAAAIIAGEDAERRMRLPNSDGWKNEVLVSKTFVVGYSHAINIGGGHIVTYGTEEKSTLDDLKNAITDKTAALYIFYNDNVMHKMADMEKQIKVAHEHGIPVVVDAAAQIPPKSNLWRFTREMGADIAIFSGGKGLRGPQASGLIVGSKKIIDIIATYACPNGGIGRPMKVGKEEIVGLMTAIRITLDMDEKALLQDFEDQVQKVKDAFKGDCAIEVERTFPSEAGQPMPRAFFKVVPGKLKVNGKDISKLLVEGQPHIFITGNEEGLYINPQTLMEGEIDIIISALKNIVAENRI